MNLSKCRRSKGGVNVFGGGISFLGLLLLLFIGLKLGGVITWSWWWVVAPLWIPFAITVLVPLIVLFITVVFVVVVLLFVVMFFMLALMAECFK